MKNQLLIFWYWICERWYKFRLRRSYNFYQCESNRYDCGYSLASYINPRIEIRKRECDKFYQMCLTYKDKRDRLKK